MEIDLGPMEVEHCLYTGHIELAGRDFEEVTTGRLGRLMLVETTKPPTVLLEVFFNEETGKYSGHHKVAAGLKMDMLPLLEIDESATELVCSVLKRIADMPRLHREKITSIWPELGRL